MNEPNYLGRVALVTGSSRGVGRLLCEHLLENGAVVIGFARGETTCFHEKYHHFHVDITNPKAIAEAFFLIRKNFSSLHILVNNAAILTSQYSMIMATNSAKAMIDTNLFAPFLVSREAAKIMRKMHWGRIINISSMAVPLEPVGDSVYAACKAGLMTMGNVMAKEFAPFDITVNTLGITAIKTDMMLQLSQDKLQEVIRGIPLPRLATAEDITNIFDFFASMRSSNITSQTVYLGGVH